MLTSIVGKYFWEEGTVMYSVVIPVFNGEDYIVETLNSILNQSVLPRSVAVVDDCSTDGTVELLTEYRKTVPPDVTFNIGCTPQGSGSAAAPRNIGIEYPLGEYVAFCDADDIWHQQKAEKQLELLSAGECDAVFTSVEKFFDKWGGERAELPEQVIRTLSVSDFRFDNPVKSCSSIMLRSDLLKLVTFPLGVEYRGVEDYYCWVGLYASKNDLRFLKLELPLVGYRQHPASVSSSKLAMSALRMRTYHYKKSMLKKAGMRMPNKYLAEIRYLMKQVL